MIGGNDFNSRAHALWRMRLMQRQRQWTFFGKVVAVATGVGALLSMRLFVSADIVSAAAQYMLALFVSMMTDMVGHDVDVTVVIDGVRQTLPANEVIHQSEFSGAIVRVVVSLALGSVAGFVLGVGGLRFIGRNMTNQGRDTMADRVLSGTRVVN